MSPLGKTEQTDIGHLYRTLHPIVRKYFHNDINIGYERFFKGLIQTIVIFISFIY